MVKLNSQNSNLELEVDESFFENEIVKEGFNVFLNNETQAFLALEDAKQKSIAENRHNDMVLHNSVDKMVIELNKLFTTAKELSMDLVKLITFYETSIEKIVEHYTQNKLLDKGLVIFYMKNVFTTLPGIVEEGRVIDRLRIELIAKKELDFVASFTKFFNKEKVNWHVNTNADVQFVYDAWWMNSLVAAYDELNKKNIFTPENRSIASNLIKTYFDRLEPLAYSYQQRFADRKVEVNEFIEKSRSLLE